MALKRKGGSGIREYTAGSGIDITGNVISATGDGGRGLPSGGTAGQVLTKKSGTDYDTEWKTPSGGGTADSVDWDDVTNKPDNIVTDADYNHTDNNYTDNDKTKLAGLATVATSGSYNDLSDKPVIPDAYDDTALAGRVTTAESAITALENADYQTAAQVDTKIADELASFDKLDYVVADSKPTPTTVVVDGETVQTKEGVRYLVENTAGGTFEEYVLLDGVIYDFGSTAQIDLDGYATETYVDGQISEHVKTDVPENAEFTDTTDLASMAGTLPVSKGGTGRTSLTNGSLLVGNGTSSVAYRSIVTTVSNSTSIPTAGAVQTALDAKADATDLTDLEARVEGIETGTTDYNLHITDVEVKTAFESVAGTSINPSYSTEEQFTGKYWIDGKKIYSKTIDCGALPNTTTKDIPHGISNLKKVVRAEGMSYVTINGTLFSSPVPYATGSEVNKVNGGIAVWISPTNITIQTTTDRSNYTETYVTIEYTKA